VGGIVRQLPGPQSSKSYVDWLSSAPEAYQEYFRSNCRLRDGREEEATEANRSYGAKEFTTSIGPYALVYYVQLGNKICTCARALVGRTSVLRWLRGIAAVHTQHCYLYKKATSSLSLSSHINKNKLFRAAALSTVIMLRKKDASITRQIRTPILAQKKT
jgi:hypothetical protein